MRSFTRKPKHTKAPVITLRPDLAPNVRQMISNMIVTQDGAVWAGYRMGSVRWDFTSLASRENLIRQVTDGYATLAGRDYIERVTSRPHPVAEWARRLDLRTPRPVAPVLIDGQAETWGRHLVRMQNRVGTAGMDDKIVFRYFGIGRIEPKTDLRAQILAFINEQVMPTDEVRAVLAEEKKVAAAVTGAGWKGQRMDEREAAWLRKRSLAPGVPAPLTSYEDGIAWPDMPALASDVRWNETPFDRTVEVTAWREGKQITRHVQVQVATRTADLKYPENGLEPWQVFVERVLDADGRPVPVEWAFAGALVTGDVLAKRAALDLGKAMSIKEGYEEHGELPPEYTERGIATAREARDQISTGQARDSVRFVGSFSAIIVGEDFIDPKTGRVLKTAAEVCEERGEAFRRRMAGTELRMEFAAPTAQWSRLRGTVPGEPYDMDGFQRQVRLPYLASGMPNVSTHVGDNAGPYIGFTLGTARKPVFHDSHYMTEGQGERGRKQNLWPVIGSLGAGKSVLANVLAYNNVRRGTKVVCDDPSGPLLKLTTMPELRAVSVGFNVLDGDSGILNPPSLVREPMPEEFDNPNAYLQARTLARGERQALAADIAARTLQADLFEDRRVMAALRAAASQVTWEQTSSLWEIVDRLDRGDEIGNQVWLALNQAAEMPMLSLLFPPRGDAGDFRASGLRRDALLTVIATPGVERAPDGIVRSDWNPKELAADSITRLTTLFADREIFSKPRDQRAVLIMDEGERLLDTGAGRGWMNRFGRDHSKWNTAGYMFLKNFTDQMMGGELRNFIAGAWVGRMANIEPAKQMLSLLHVDDERYASYLMGLSERSPGEFVHLDGDGNVFGMKVDVDYFPRLKEVVLTNPTPEGAEGWGVKEGEMV